MMELNELLSRLATGDPEVLTPAPAVKPKRRDKFKELTPRVYSYTGGPAQPPSTQARPAAWHVTPLTELACRRYNPATLQKAAYRPEHFIGIYPGF
jgi:hypothetical protein